MKYCIKCIEIRGDTEILLQNKFRAIKQKFNP